MPFPVASAPARSAVADGLVVDSRLALHHPRDRWLAVTDLHFGYELVARHQGHLHPLWGMDALARRLHALLEDYRPRTVILLGDVVHASGVETEAAAFLATLSAASPGCDLVCIAGNHDRGPLRGAVPFVDEWTNGRFRFHHGHEPDRLRRQVRGQIQVTGHLHPIEAFQDGAGLALRLPVLLRACSPHEGVRWILPAFSPWAGGRDWRKSDVQGRIRRWVCSPHRVFEVGDA